MRAHLLHETFSDLIGEDFYINIQGFTLVLF